MTVQEAIDQIDNVKPNPFTIEEKVKWLSDLDGMVYEELIKTHDDFVETSENKFTGYTTEDMDETLLIPFPFEKTYIDWLASQIDLTNGDISRYNANTMVFMNKFTDFSNWYGRNHMPTQKRGWRL